MTVKLPKDAAGREIPLDTEILYDEDGNEYEVYCYKYPVRQTIPQHKWQVVMTDHIVHDCSDIYIAPPDSWERLEEDLTAFDDGQIYGPCHYFHELDDDCMSCPARDDACAGAVMRDVASRIRNLRVKTNGHRVA